MERRNRSLEALDKLQYIDALDNEDRAVQLATWVNKYLENESIEDFDLEYNDLKKLSELFYKNINFLKQHRKDVKHQLDSHHKIKQFLH
ncbi:MAG: hypothetical protein U9R39_01735 [Campylobacterota bacterium]|nr:hypothetical protein [Campylobacterota bacterium]